VQPFDEWEAVSMNERLAKELAALRRRGLTRVGIADRRLKPLELPVLTELATRPGLSERDAITAVVRAGIDHLEEGLARQTLTRLYGLDRDPSDPKPDVWRAEARAWHPHMSSEEFRRGPEWHALGLLADAITTLDYTAPSASSRVTAVSGASGRRPRSKHYVWRQSYADRFAKLLSRGCDRIVLLGQPGMGKSQLADDLVHAHATSPDHVAWIRLHTPDMLQRELRAACQQRGITVDAGSHITVHHLLHRLLTDERAPEFTVLDTVDLADDLVDLLPLTMRSVVVATSWAHTTPIAGASFIRVNALDSAETDAVLQSRCPDLTSDERMMLSLALGGQPGVTNHIARLVKARTLNPAAAVDALTCDTSTFVSAIPIGVGRTLRDGLHAVTRTLATHNDTAALLLAGISHLPAGSSIPSVFLSAYAQAGVVDADPVEIPAICA
ncbi:MAG: hypothetical protein ACRDQZ_24800, partial [Mycobacteriales bacterium]